MQYFHMVYQKTDHQDGFSLLELIVAVSIMLILGTTGFVSYQVYTDNARHAAADTVAHNVLTATVASDNTPNGDPIEELKTYNKNTDNIVANITEATAESLTITATDAKGTSATATIPGNYSHLDVTSFSEPGVHYGWVGERYNSPSVKYRHDTPVASNAFLNPLFMKPANRVAPLGMEEYNPTVKSTGQPNTGELTVEDGKLTISTSLTEVVGRYGVKLFRVEGYENGDVIRVKFQADLGDKRHRVGVYTDGFKADGTFTQNPSRTYFEEPQINPDEVYEVEMIVIPDTDYMTLHLWIDSVSYSASPAPSTATFWEPYVGSPEHDFFHGDSQ